MRSKAFVLHHAHDNYGEHHGSHAMWRMLVARCNTPPLECARRPAIARLTTAATGCIAATATCGRRPAQWDGTR